MQKCIPMYYYMVVQIVQLLAAALPRTGRDFGTSRPPHLSLNPHLALAAPLRLPRHPKLSHCFRCSTIIHTQLYPTNLLFLLNAIMGAAMDSFLSYLRIPLIASSGIAALLSGMLYFKQK